MSRPTLYNQRNNSRSSSPPLPNPLDNAEVLRSPHAAAGRVPTAFSADPTGSDPFTSRQRPKPGVPAPPRELPTHYSRTISASTLLPSTNLSVRTTPRAASKRLLATPLGRRIRRASPEAIRIAAVVAVLLLFLLGLLFRRRPTNHGASDAERNIAPCLPSYAAIESGVRQSKGVGRQGSDSASKASDVQELQPSIAMVAMHDSHKWQMPCELAQMTGALVI
jgi:hypothetical protein